MYDFLHIDTRTERKRNETSDGISFGSGGSPGFADGCKHLKGFSLVLGHGYVKLAKACLTKAS